MLSLMARDSMREFARFESRTGRSIGFLRSGVCTLVGPEQPEWQERVRAICTDLQDYGIDIHAIEAPEIRGVLPGMEVAQGSVAAWEPSAGFVDPLLTVDAFAALARSYGAVTRLATQVEEILVEDGRVTGARTSEGVCTADQVVVVGGPWSRNLLAAVGVELPLRAVVPENSFFAMPEEHVEDVVEGPARRAGLSFDIEDPQEEGPDLDIMQPRGLHPVLIDLEREFYARCEPPNRRTRVGRIDYHDDPVLEDPDDRPEEASDASQSWAREKLVSRFPEYADRPDAGAVTSWYTLTPDSQPVVGPVGSVAGLFVATGFSGHGFKLAPSIGEGLAQMLFDEPVTAFEPELFAPGRFADFDGEWTGRFGL